jgi:putative tryptophan/tyrosine transport system substrate-binding protein
MRGRCHDTFHPWLLGESVHRRDFLKWTAAATQWPLVANAQQAGQVHKVGILVGTSESDPEAQLRISGFIGALAKAGWSEGKNVQFEKRFAGGQPERLQALAAELAAAKVDVIVTEAAQPSDAAHRATATIPIVMSYIGDALATDYVQSLARPGKNVTGQTLVATDQAAKRLELISEFLPDATRIAVMSNLNASGHKMQRKEMAVAAPRLRIELQFLSLTAASEIDGGLRQAIENRAQAIITMEDPMVESARKRIIAFATENHIPVMGEFRPMTESGGLMNYGPNQVRMWERSAVYVDRIFKGAIPADLPIEQPVKFEMIINLKTAKTLGLDVPSTLLALADDIIE